MKSSGSIKKRASGLWAGAIAAVVLGWLFYIPFRGDQKLTSLSYDLLLLFKRDIPPADVVIVFQDEESHEKLEQPHEVAWDRKLHAQLLRRLKADGSRAVIFDLVFDEPSVTNNDDVVFADAIHDHGKVVLANHYVASGEAGWAAGMTLKSPIPLLATNAAATGVEVVYRSIDSVVRLLYAGASHGSGGDSYPTFTWMAAELEGAPVTKRSEIERRRWLNYYGPPETIANVSYYRALSLVPAGFFRDKVVLVGVASQIGYTGAGKDTFPSPFLRGNPQFAGVEIHATTLANLLRSEWLSNAPMLAEMFLLGLTGLVLGRCLSRLRPLLATGLAVGIAVLLALAACFAAWHLHFWFPWLTIVVIQIPIALGWSVLFHWVQSQLQNQFLEQSMSMYLSPKLVKKFSRDKDRSVLKPGAEKMKLTILFSDIAGFTSVSEGMDSDELAKMMNEYFESAVGNCIHPTDGTVVKYIGDAIFAFWNAPEPQPDHAVRACDAALRFREMSAVEVRGKKLITRIGLHTGVANVGNFGSSTRVDYTALGEDINLAARMEGLNKYLGTTVLLTGAVRKEISERFITRYLGRFQLKGFENAVEVHELLAKAEESDTVLIRREDFASGLKLFQASDLAGAEQVFSRLHATEPDDGPTEFYLKHVTEMRQHPLPANWNGEVELKEK